MNCYSKSCYYLTRTTILNSTMRNCSNSTMMTKTRMNYWKMRMRESCYCYYCSLMNYLMKNSS